MHKTFVLLLLVACSSESPKLAASRADGGVAVDVDAILAEINRLKAIEAKTAPGPRNLICERVTLLSPKAECTPEMSGEGPLLTHSARVTLPDAKVPIVCALNAGQPTMGCSGLEAAPSQAPEATPKNKK